MPGQHSSRKPEALQQQANGGSSRIFLYFFAGF
jgi:hypothetical protein